MIALDTNVVLRILLQDDPEQSRRARELLESGDVFLPKTVLLETEWVLRSAYGIDDAEIHAGLLKLVNLANAVVEDRPQILDALALHERGFGFADALHHAASHEADSFRTFDMRLLRRGARASVHPAIQSV